MSAPAERPEHRCGRTLPHLTHLTLQGGTAYQCPGIQAAPEPTPAPLSEQQLAELELRNQIANALSSAGAYCGDCGFEPGDRGACTHCEQHWTWCADKLLPLFDAASARVAELEAERHTTNEALSEAAEAIRAKDQRVAELESIAGNAKKLYHEWLSTSAEHSSISTLKEVRETPLLAGMQEGRANQYSDCANELRDVLDGEDPDDWEHGVSVEVAKAGEPS